MIPMPVDDPLAMAWLDTNDLGNAERLVRLARGLLLWVEVIGWVGYDGARWSARDGDRMASRLAHDVARHIDDEARALHDIAEDEKALEQAFGWPVPPEVAKDRVVALRKHAVKSGNASMTQAMLTQARTLIAARREDFDVDPLAFNCINGTLRFVEVQGGGWVARFALHDPTDMMMQMSRFGYDPAATCPRWIERLHLVQPDREQRRLLQTLYGYALTGLTSEQKWFIYQGRGGDGKSATNIVIAKLMADYHRHADVKTFLEGGKKSGSDHSSDIVRLAGDVRLVTCEEPTRNSTWNAMLLKQITGGTVTARGMREKEIEFDPRLKLIVEVNPLPAVPTDDDGFWRRCWPIPWSYQFDKGGQASEPLDLLVKRFVEDEGSGILNWMIAGALKWLETRRLPRSETAETFKGSYRQSASPIGDWLGECCDLSDPRAEEPAGTLFNAFKIWCEAAGVDKVPTQASFGRALRDRQCLERRTAGKRFRRGIRLLSDREMGEKEIGEGGRAVVQPPSRDVDPENDLPI